MSLVDKHLKCRDCGGDFIFTVGEQEFYQLKGLLNDPQRCPSCRAVKRQQRTGVAPREMFDVVCSECGAPARVPFNPRNDRPVYCSSCYDRVRAR
ncbi:MAG: zinc-ribbon domain containing protein [Chloroflexi bacterium]|nr:zinc-ribbon domain containing protein [Chloroflexota bacterium]